jgi:uncharacterized protein (TIGR00369 family)
MDNTLERTRTITWDEPLGIADAGIQMSGMEYLQAMIDGKLPRSPISHTLDFALTEIGEGRATFTAEPAEYHYNPIGSVHGGLAATLLDSALGCAIHTMMPAGVGYATLELHINFVRPLTAQTGRVYSHGEIIHVGRTVATAQGRVVDEAGKLYAHGTTTCMIFRAEERNGQ